MPSAARDGRRLEFADDLFVRLHRGLGSPVVNQWTWRLEEPYDAAHVRRVAEGMARGALSRQWRRGLVPGARDRWTASDVDSVADLHTTPIPADEVEAWLRDRAEQPLDPARGRTCRLSAVDLDDGTSVVSLLLCHAVGDGGAVFDTVMRAAAGTPYRIPPVPSGLGRRIGEDLVDAGQQVAAVAEWGRARLTWLARRDGATAATAPAVERRSARPLDLPLDWRPPRLVAELDSARLAEVAAAAGGSVNGLFAAMLARIVVASGLLTDASAVRVALPVSVREEGEIAANRTRIAVATFTPDMLASRDLSVVKAACKQAFSDLASAGPGDVPVPLALVQMLPDAVVRRLPQPPQAVALASNLGRVPDAFAAAMGPRARAVSAMAHYQGANAQENRQLGSGIGAWLTDAGTRTTLQVGAMAPDVVPTRERLRRLVADECATWGLTPQWW
ncbi:MAG: hypothetical protein FWE71_10920 [Nocardioidaceae bacterium]|nr:hypothetical protein [Nocardioidaceae bacterium]MCL2611874.1 hypothetical protein [Nocardioidaceae bacterium]